MVGGMKDLVKHHEVYTRLLNGSRQSQVAHMLGIRKDVVSKRVRWLKENDYLQQTTRSSLAIYSRGSAYKRFERMVDEEKDRRRCRVNLVGTGGCPPTGDRSPAPRPPHIHHPGRERVGPMDYWLGGDGQACRAHNLQYKVKIYGASSALPRSPLGWKSWEVKRNGSWKHRTEFVVEGVGKVKVLASYGNVNKTLQIFIEPQYIRADSVSEDYVNHWKEQARLIAKRWQKVSQQAGMCEQSPCRFRIGEIESVGSPEFALESPVRPPEGIRGKVRLTPTRHIDFSPSHAEVETNVPAEVGIMRRENELVMRLPEFERLLDNMQGGLLEMKDKSKNTGERMDKVITALEMITEIQARSELGRMIPPEQIRKSLEEETKKNNGIDMHA